MKNRISIGFHYEGMSIDDHYSLFTVEKEESKGVMIAQIKKHWDNFQTQEPDSDSEFEKYLEGFGFTLIKDEPHLLILDA